MPQQSPSPEGAAVAAPAAARWPVAFRAFVANAADGPNSLWRIALSLLLVLVVWMAGTALTLGVAALIATGYSAGDETLLDALSHADIALDSRLGVAALLLSLAWLWPAVWLAVRLIHRRRFSGVLGREHRLSWPQFLRGALAALAAYVILLPLGFLIDPTLERTELSLAAWALGLVPFALLVLLQASAEELLFRGYMHQALARRFPSPVIWAALPTVLFTLMHFNGGMTAAMNAAILVAIAGFSVTMTLLVYRTGNLGAACGAHFGLNVFGLLIVSSDSDVGSAALFRGRSLQDPSWSAADCALLAVSGVLTGLVILVLLLHPRSPLRLAAAKAPSRGTPQA